MVGQEPAFAAWAHVLAYDVSLTAGSEAAAGGDILCCHPEMRRSLSLRHPACLPIHVPPEDPLAEKTYSGCMHFLRSAAAPRPDCKFGPREQLNQATAYVDGSSLYGSSEHRLSQLRSHQRGKLKSSGLTGGEMWPTNQSMPCTSRHTPCFNFGDVRANVDVRLAVVHGLLLREHNRLAGALARANPGWGDEVLFRETRRLLVAQIQHITYSEFLPLLLGSKVMSSYGLSPKLSGYSFDYDPEVNADVANVFATAANRYGHSLVQDVVAMYYEDGERRELKISREFDPSLLHTAGNFDALVRGLVRQPAQTLDVQVAERFREDLFGGLDLVSLSIQRGREHGLAGYNEWRQHCGLPALTDFRQLDAVMGHEQAEHFSRLYRSVDDVDLFPAGLSELPLPDALLGPTFACLLAEQFRKLKVGDRFWYENGGMESSFTEAQLRAVRETSLSRLLCDHSALESVQLVAFLQSADWNPTEECESRKIPSMNLNAWKNEPVWSR